MLPEYYKKSEVLKNIYAVSWQELKREKASIESLKRQLDPALADVSLYRWLTEYDIDTNGATNEVLIGKIRGKGIVDLDLIKEVAASYSNGEVEATQNADEFLIYVKFVGTLGIPQNIEALKMQLEEIIPAHGEIEYIYVYNTWQDVEKLTWEQAKAYTWEQIRTVKL